MDLSPLHNALGDLEKAVQGIAEKVSTAVSTDVSQQEVDDLVSRVGAQVERLAGLQAPATKTATEAPAPTSPAAESATPAAPPGEVAAWTPANPAA
jgi:hypothetical protein